MKKKAIIVSIKGLKLTNKEKLLISKEKPWGLILFKRNIKSINQVIKLVNDIKKSAKDKNLQKLFDASLGTKHSVVFTSRFLSISRSRPPGFTHVSRTDL